MARIEHIKRRLENWALWKDRESRGGLGFSATSAFLRQHSGDGYREIPVPIIDEDASITDQAVASLQPSRPDLHRAIWLHYIGEPHQLTVVGVAAACGVSVDAAHKRMAAADRAIALWLQERAERQNQFHVI